MFPRWLPLYIVGLAALTLFPFTSPECSVNAWETRFGIVDFAANFTVFVPIGLALHRSPVLRAVLLAFALSLAIEISQQWLPRQPDTTDLISNTLGAAFGRVLGEAWMVRWPGPLLRPITWRIAVWTLAPLLLLDAGFASIRGPRHDFSNWASFPLVIGNSARGDKPWLGEISQLAIYDHALQLGEEPPRGGNADTPARWRDRGPILWLDFANGASTVHLDGPDGPARAEVEPLEPTLVDEDGLTLEASGLTLEPRIADHVTERLRATGTMTVDVRLRAGAKSQHGPARIVELGDGQRFRNFMLGQQGTTLLAMIRTPASGRGGALSPVQSRGNKVSTEDQNVRLLYDGAHAELSIDGACAAVSHMALELSPWILGPFLGITIVASTSLAALGLAWLAPLPRRRTAYAALGAVLAWSFLWVVGAWSGLPDFSLTSLGLTLLSLATTLPLLRRSR